MTEVKNVKSINKTPTVTKDTKSTSSKNKKKLTPIQKWKNLSTRAKVYITLASTLTLGAVVYEGYTHFNNKIYLVDVENDSELAKYFYNVNANADLIALVGSKKTKDGTMYEAILYNGQEMLGTCEINGKYLPDTPLDSVNIGEYDIYDLLPGKILGENGVNLRDEAGGNIIGGLGNLAEVIMTPHDKTTKDGTWSETIVVTGDSLSKGYVYSNNTYRMDPKDEMYFIRCDSLNLRSKPDLESSVLKVLKKDTPVFLSSTPAVIVGNHKMKRVYTTDATGNKDYGWIAAEVLENGNTITKNITTDYPENYILNVNTEPNYDTAYFINTDTAGGKDLNLRDKPSFKGNIIDNIYNGSFVYSCSQNFNNPINSEGVKWMFVNYNGRWGYISRDYIQTYAAEACAVMDNNGNIIYSKNGDERLAPASITKVLAVLTALNKCNDLNKKIPITQEAVNRCQGDYATIYPDIIYPGAELTLEEALKAILVSSDNTVTQSVMNELFGSEEKAVKAMNHQTKIMGCQNTNIINVFGERAPMHYTTANDYNQILKEAMKNPKIAKVMGTDSYSLNGNGPICYNHAGILLEGNPNYNPHVIGSKTGTTSAGLTLTSASYEGYYATVLGATNRADTYIVTNDLFDLAETTHSQILRRQKFVEKYARGARK